MIGVGDQRATFVHASWRCYHLDPQVVRFGWILQQFVLFCAPGLEVRFYHGSFLGRIIPGRRRNIFFLINRSNLPIFAGTQGGRCVCRCAFCSLLILGGRVFSVSTVCFYVAIVTDVYRIVIFIGISDPRVYCLTRARKSRGWHGNI